MSCQNFSRVLLVLLAIFFFCVCEAKRDVKIGETAPEFSSTDITGKPVSLSQFKGKIVIIYFWRNSCCADSLKSVEPYYRSIRHKELAVIAINVGDSKEIVTSYAKSNDLTITMLTDEHSIIFKQYQAFCFPTILIINKKGVIRKRIMGNIRVDQLEKLIQNQFDTQKHVEAAYEKNNPR